MKVSTIYVEVAFKSLLYSAPAAVFLIVVNVIGQIALNAFSGEPMFTGMGETLWLSVKLWALFAVLLVCISMFVVYFTRTSMKHNDK